MTVTLAPCAVTPLVFPSRAAAMPISMLAVLPNRYQGSRRPLPYTRQGADHTGIGDGMPSKPRMGRRPLETSPHLDGHDDPPSFFQLAKHIPDALYPAVLGVE